MTTWNQKLIGQTEALELAGAEPVTWVRSDTGMVLRHLPCGTSCGLWAPGHQTSADEMIAAVLRHLVTYHDLPLNRAERERRAAHERTGNRHPAGHARHARDGGQEPGTGDAPPGPDPGPAAGGAAPGTAGRRVRGPAGETGGDRT